MTEAVIGALQAELKREDAGTPLAERLAALADRLKAKLDKGSGRDMSNDEIGAMWGMPDVRQHFGDRHDPLGRR